MIHIDGRLKEAFDALDTSFRSGDLNMGTLSQVHRLVLSPHQSAGVVRNEGAVVLEHGRAIKSLPTPREARDRADNSMRWLNQKLSNPGRSYNPVAIAEEIVNSILQVHPFWDGNGRTARTIGSWVLFRSGYEPVFDLRAYCHSRRHEYYRVLIARQRSNNRIPWTMFFRRMVGYCFKPPISAARFAPPSSRGSARPT